MTTGQSILVVDGVPETEQVLRAVMEPRGHQVERVRAFELDKASTEQHVLIVHDEGAPATRRSKHGKTPRVVIGSITTPASDDANERQLAHPFHYAELIRAVESLLNDQSAQRTAAEVRVKQGAYPGQRARQGGRWLERP